MSKQEDHDRALPRWATTAVTVLVTVGLSLLFSTRTLSQVNPESASTDQPQRQASSEQIEGWLEQLDSGKYQLRESAAKALQSSGSASIEPLARRLLDGSPELHWRIRGVLEEIALRSGRDELYQVAAILKFRFNYGALEIRALEASRRSRIRESAINTLRQAGVQVNDPVEEYAQFQANAFEPQFGIRIIQNDLGPPVVINRGRIQLQASDEATEPAAEPKQQWGPKELESRLDQILDATADENRELVLGPDPTPDSSRSPQQELLRQFADSQPYGFDQRIQVTFDQRWNQDFEALRVLKEFEIAQISFSEIEIQAKLLEAIGDRGIDVVSISNCQVQESAGIANSGPRARQSLHLLGVKDVQTWFQQFLGPNTPFVSLEGCELSPGIVQVMEGASVEALQLNGITIAREVFEAMAEWKQLQLVRLNACRFSVADYDWLASKRRNDLSISFSAAAFLGVSAQPIDGEKVVITRVVEGSAAALAGIQVGDAIVEIGDEEVTDFERLKLLIAQYQIGDEVEIEVRRQSETIVLKAKLGQNDEVIFQ